MHLFAAGLLAVMLIDQRGAPFSFADLRGSNVVVTFVAARCTDACPLIEAQTSAARDDARLHGKRVRYLTITLDPAHDTRAVMAQAARRFHADPRNWIFATGAPRAIAETMRAFGAAGNPRAHTTFVYVLDESGRERAAFPASNDVAGEILGSLP